MGSLASDLSLIVGEAFASAGLPQNLGLVRVSDRPDLAQFQCNGAMAAAKQAKKAPRVVAESVVEALTANPIFTQLEIAGPGFINISVSDDYISNYANRLAGSDTSLISMDQDERSIVLDYGGPNIAKSMHVGHLRSSIIGDCLRRMYGFAGHKTYGDVHMGDWGLPMGQVLSELQINNPDWVYFDDSYTGTYPDESPVTIKDLAKIYPIASSACKEDEKRLELARDITAKLQDGHAGYRALWRHFITVSIDGMKANFDAMGVHFDLWLGESDAHDTITPMVDDLQKRGIAEESNGALVVMVEQDSDKKEMPPLILYKSNGAVMYSTTDMATLVDRMRDYNPAKVIYLTDKRQSLHFEQVFRAARKGSIVPENVDLVHAGFGTMNGTDGKPFKTRAGGVMNLKDLINMSIEKATARLNEANLAADIQDDERADIAQKVGLAALKFADLQNNRTSDYIFDLDRMTSFEGKTGPYLLYQVVRIKSLLAKADKQGIKPAQTLNVNDGDRVLSLLLGEFSDHFANALENHTPHVLCDYAHKLAQTFSSFYGNCHILTDGDEKLRRERLALCALTARQLSIILDILGIQIPERM